MSDHPPVAPVASSDVQGFVEALYWSDEVVERAEAGDGSHVRTFAVQAINAWQSHIKEAAYIVKLQNDEWNAALDAAIEACQLFDVATDAIRGLKR